MSAWRRRKRPIGICMVASRRWKACATDVGEPARFQAREDAGCARVLEGAVEIGGEDAGILLGGDHVAVRQDGLLAA